MIEYLYLIPVGILISTFATSIGLGGGLLWAPFLILIMGFEPQQATIYSFIFQIVGMGSATFTNIKNKTIYWKLALKLSPFILIGLIGGSFLNQQVISADVLQFTMGIMSIFVCLFFVFQTEKYDTVLSLDRRIKPPRWLSPLSVVFGSLSGLFSVGIGDNLIPILRSKMKIPMRYAIGTSLMLNFFISLTGIVSHIAMSKHGFTNINMYLLIYSWIGVIVGGQLGPRVSSQVSDNRLKEFFVFILLLIGIHLIYQSL